MRRASVMVAVAVLLCGPWAAADGWVSLFNGKDLEGWRVHGEERWSVEDGAIVGQTGAGKAGWLIAEGRYSDFVLRLRFRMEGPGNSGVQFRSWLEGGRMHGYQADVEPNDIARTGSIYCEHERRWLQRTKPDPQRVVHREGWNDLEVSAIGDRLRVWVNGVAATDLTYSRTSSGFVALQVHAARQARPCKVRWKDIRILDLAPGTLVHSVYFWLKDGATEKDAEALIADCRAKLQPLEGVARLDVGRPAPGGRGVVDASYHVGLVVVFADREAYQAYLDHPDHLALVEKHKPLWERIVVYDVMRE
ncbi:MAG: family 16 glycoside hydrolase [Candidatus Brocadiia bacterium]